MSKKDRQITYGLPVYKDKPSQEGVALGRQRTGVSSEPHQAPGDPIGCLLPTPPAAALWTKDLDLRQGDVVQTWPWAQTVWRSWWDSNTHTHLLSKWTLPTSSARTSHVFWPLVWFFMQCGCAPNKQLERGGEHVWYPGCRGCPPHCSLLCMPLETIHPVPPPTLLLLCFSAGLCSSDLSPVPQSPAHPSPSHFRGACHGADDERTTFKQSLHGSLRAHLAPWRPLHPRHLSESSPRARLGVLASSAPLGPQRASEGVPRDHQPSLVLTLWLQSSRHFACG